MDPQQTRQFIDGVWDETIVPNLIDYIRIPNKSPHFDPDWEGGIRRTTLRLFREAEADGITPLDAALRLADSLASEPHPIWGHRTRQLIESLTRNGWATGR